MSEKAALLRLMDRVARAGSLEEVYESALLCLQTTLGVERASVQVFDREGTMRFVAWSGLSEFYRRAVGGYTPWGPDEQEPAPILIRDVREASHLGGFRAPFERERIRALAFIPLRFGTKLLGKFMLYRAEPHTFTSHEITIAETIAGHIAYALEHHRIAGELEGRLQAERLARRQAEQEAAQRVEQERRLRLALEAGEMGIWQWILGSDRVVWSEELERIHGVGPGGFGGTFQDFLRDVHPQDRAGLLEAIERALRGEDQHYEVEYRIVAPDGAIRYLAGKGRVLYDERGNPNRMIGVCSDVTRRKRIDQAQGFVAEASRILATTLEPDAIVRNLAQITVPRIADWCAVFVVDEHGHIIPVDVTHRDPDKVEQAWQIVRRWRTPMPGGPVAATVELGRSTLISRVDDAMLPRLTEGEEHLRLLQSLHVLSAMIVPLQARGRVLGALVLASAESQRVYDKTDLRFAADIGGWAALAIDNAQLYRQAEQARSAAELARQRFQTLAEVSDELVSSLEPEQILKRLSEHLVTKLADYCVTYAFDGTSIRRLGFAHLDPAKRPLVEALADTGHPTLQDAASVGAVIRTGEDLLLEELTSELIMRSTDDTRRREVVQALDPRSSIIVVLRARGTTLGAIALVTTGDSERRYDQEDFRLAKEIANRAAMLVDNARLFAEARDALRARDEMLAVISHDLRSPFQSISTAAEMLGLDPPPEQRARSVETISLATSQVDRLLRDLLDIARVERGGVSIEKESTNVAALVAEAHKLVEPLAARKAVKVRCRCGKNVPAVRVDRSRMLQVLSNLLGNALKFVSENGRVEVTGTYEDGKVRIAVTDDGVGIEEQHLERVFDRFWKANRRADGGAGLGLTIAKGIVEAHGGVIGVQSKEGQGTTFYILLDPDGSPAPSFLPEARQGETLVVEEQAHSRPGRGQPA